jgi:hypothetical protein
MTKVDLAKLDRKQLAPLKRAAAKAERAERAAEAARVELSNVLKATRPKGYTVRELADAAGISPTKTHALLNL